MTDVVEGTVFTEGEWTPQEAASHVSEAWQNAVHSIIETGRRLNGYLTPGATVKSRMRNDLKLEN